MSAIQQRLKTLEQASNAGIQTYIILLGDEPLPEGVRPEDIIDISSPAEQPIQRTQLSKET